MPIKKKNSLRNEVNAILIETHSDLLLQQSFWKKYLDKLALRKNWWLVSINVIGLFLLLAFVKIPFLDFIKIDIKTAETLIDQRTSNVATVISMTLAVVGLLLSNMAIKDSQTYKLLFVKSRLYLTIYFTLSTIFLLIVISTLRDTLKEYDHLYQQMVLAGTYLVLLVIVVLGNLFLSIVNFADSSKIMNVLKTEFMIETKIVLLENLWQKYSKEKFNRLMANLHISPMPNSVKLADSAHPEKMIYDMNLHNLEKALADLSKSQLWYYVAPFSLYANTRHYQGFISMNGAEPAKNKATRKCLVLKSANQITKKDPGLNGYFGNKLVEYTREQKKEKIEEVLNLFLEVYILEMKHA
jgi:hypothetical protein